MSGSGVELKSVDVAVSNTAASVAAMTFVPLYIDNGTIGTNFCWLNEILEGAALVNRVGRTVNMKLLELDLQIVRTVPTGGNAVIPVTEDYARIMIIYDRQANSAFPPSWHNILADKIAANTDIFGVYNHINMDSRDRIRVLMDKRVYLNSITAGAGNIGGGTDNNINLVTDTAAMGSNYRIAKNIPLRGLETQYIANNGNIGDIMTGSLLLLVLGGACSPNYSGGGSPALPRIQPFPPFQVIGNARLRFTDSI